ncbi:hypothetical protein EU508_00895 [Pseudoalteromonas fuliginea]|uniref:Phytanoyl-CoA dioxygenase n=1 Tax=Pseudoalteromonas fuliginea TaxID=1872678 RepID=A0AB73BLI4_9GAMM|nr:phytanoyl-CoA dioxygenase family protein [Pseudoalteromonas fuliginea]KAA1164818.1 hypothetical protein EU508_00895 [Pseudoalteromonas fuliginea]
MTHTIFKNNIDNDLFSKQGFIIKKLLSDEDVLQLKALYDNVADHHAFPFTATVLIQNTPLREYVHREIRSVFSSRIRPILENYRLVVGSFASKKANSEHSKVALHQDITFIENEGKYVGLSIWCPLVSVNANNGWLGVVPGSHHFNTDYRDASVFAYPNLVETIENEYMTYLSMQPGEVLLMDNRIIHGSPSNKSHHDRVVTAGVAVPVESNLIYCHRDYQNAPEKIEIYDVEEGFYISHQLGCRPNHLKPKFILPVTTPTSQETHHNLLSLTEKV